MPFFFYYSTRQPHKGFFFFFNIQPLRLTVLCGTPPKASRACLVVTLFLAGVCTLHAPSVCYIDASPPSGAGWPSQTRVQGVAPEARPRG